jgi:hypothetical protein
MHRLGVYSDRTIETTDSAFKTEFFLDARKRSWEGLERIWESLKPGESELQASKRAAEILSEMGSPRSWHRAIIRFGKNTSLPYSVKSDGSSLLSEGSPVLIDIGPVWKLAADSLDYEGDVGDTRIFGGENKVAADCAETARRLFIGASKFWKDENLSGESIYQWLRVESEKLGYELLDSVNGHRLSDFPHARFFKGNLAAVSFKPSPNVWMLEVHLKDLSGEFGAFYEDALI